MNYQIKSFQPEYLAQLHIFIYSILIFFCNLNTLLPWYTVVDLILESDDRPLLIYSIISVWESV